MPLPMPTALPRLYPLATRRPAPLAVLVAGLAAALAWVAWRAVAGREAPRHIFGRTPDAVPFPTQDGHAGIRVDDDTDVDAWCRTFDCTREQLRAAVRNVGNRPNDVLRYLARRR